MPDAREHIVAGVIAGAVIGYLTEEQAENSNTTTNLPLACIAGGMSGKLPNVLEPASNPNHRQFFHSVAFSGGVVAAGYQLYKWQPRNGAETMLRVVGLAACGGYLSHILLDSTTPKSIPVL